MNSPYEMLVVSGPNGSGKTTVARVYAKRFNYPYIGADDIAATLAPNDPVSKRIEAGRQFAFEVTASIQDKRNIVVESTLSGRTFVHSVQAARDAGYSISVVHLFLDSADTCVARVAERVRKGGHDVPENDIRRRFARSAANFWHLYRPLCDRWVLMYNATTDAQSVAEGDSHSHSVRDSQLFNSFMQIVQTND